MRGARDQDRSPEWKDGIIPAYAGSTCCHLNRLEICEDHPRVCGEHMVVGPSEIITAGSSPRMRGALAYVHSHTQRQRIIPAYAGSTQGRSLVLDED